MLTIVEDTAVSFETFEPCPVTLDLSASKGLSEEFPEQTARFMQMAQEALPRLWSSLTQHLKENPWVLKATCSVTPLSIGVVLVNNSEIQALNRQFRAKDQPTDVLTFSLTEDLAQPDLSEIGVSDEIPLGEIYISLAWSIAAVCNENQPKLNSDNNLTLHSMERLIHGCLHIMGVHHDTEEDYQRVVTIQRNVLNAVFPFVSTATESSVE